MTQANIALLAKILEIKGEHPFWGYRRVWAYLHNRLEVTVNHKRVYRLMKLNNLLVRRNEKLKAVRGNLKEKPRADKPNQIWGTDMTKVQTGSGWAYLHVVIDWYTKKIVGWSVERTSHTRDWIAALNMAVNAQFPDGIRESGTLMLVSDNGCQPTSNSYANTCNSLNIKQIFTCFANPKGNADTERVMRTIKEDLAYINEYQSVTEFRVAFGVWVGKYNYEFPHSAIKYRTPYQMEREYVNALSLQVSR
jgi:putative transposase